jgi:5'-nucleotidase / UDP-sugar diphosphatase
MKRRRWLALVLMCIGAVLLMAYGLLSATRPSALPPAEAATTEAGTAPATSQGHTRRRERVVLLYTNDLHGAVEVKGNHKGEVGGLVNLVSLIDQVRAQAPEHTLLLDAGDTFQGSYLSNSTQGEVVMAAMNLAGYDAWTLGNHEFDWGLAVLQERIGQATFPALAANLYDAVSGRVWEAVEPYTIVRAGRARVAILGLTYPATPVINKPANVAGLDFRGASESVHRYLPEIESQADLIVVLSHLGYDGDQALATAVDGVDIIIGGHSHLFLDRPVKVHDTLIVQAGAKGEVLGKLELEVDLTTGGIVDYSRQDLLLPVDGRVSQVNEQVQALVTLALEQAAEMMQQPIGETARALEPKRTGEFALGNLVVDALLAADLSDGSKADIAMHNNGGIRAGLPQGPVTYGQLYEVLPFDNQVVALDLTGAQVLSILERSVAEGPGKMQVAGLSFRFNSARPAGQRILEAQVGDQPLELQAVYRVVTIDYLAAGGDGQVAFLEGTNLTYAEDAMWVVAEYIRAHSPVAPKVEGRIQGR